VIVLEPTFQALVPAEAGRDWVRVTFRGCTPLGSADQGVSALDIAVRFVTAVQQLAREWATRKPPHPLLPPGVNTIRPGVLLCGGGLGANGLPQRFDNPAATPDAAVIDFDLTYLPHEATADIRAEFEAFVLAFAQQDSWLRGNPPEVLWDLHGMRFPPLDTPTDHPLCRAIIDARAARKLPTEIRGFAGVCDAAHYAGVGVPGVIYGPGGGGLHAADEYVDLDSLRIVTQTLAAAVVRWCGAA
jgi:acetylornithine deacetylase